jgi:hypothetical protein
MLLASVAAAQWSSDPGSPVVAGPSLPSGLDRPVLAHGPDGATWIAWVDDQCFGSLRAQRIDASGNVLVDGGLLVETLNACVSTTALLEVSDDGGAVVARADFVDAGPGMMEATIARIASDGSAGWIDPILAPTHPTPAIGALHALPGGDVLVAWRSGASIWVSRHGALGEAVWSAPTEIPTINGSNMRLLGVADDGAGGVFVVWDHPLGPYLRRIRAARVLADGSLAWDSIFVDVSGTPESSRHSIPVFAPDGLGGIAVFYTEGRESSGTIADLLMQRVSADGSLVFQPSGAQVSLGNTSQFDPRIAFDAQSGDFMVAWRDNTGATSTLRAQRMGVEGERRWGDAGVEIADLGGLGGGVSGYDTIWDGARMLVSHANAPGTGAGVVVHRIAGNGAVSAEPWVISDASSASRVRIVPSGNASIVSWIRDDAGIPDSVVAQRVNANGQLGPVSLLGDLNGDCLINFTDLNGVLGAFGSTDPSGDANGDGITDFSDLNLVLSNFGRTCDE